MTMLEDRSAVEQQQQQHQRPPNAVEALDVPYERAATPWYSHRGAFYLLVFLLLLNVVATTSVTWGPLVMRAVQDRMAARRAAQQQAVAAAQAAVAQRVAIQRQQAVYQQCAQFALPEGQVVYSEDPVEAERLVSAGTGYSCVGQVNSSGWLALPALPAMRNNPAGFPAPAGVIQPRTGTLMLHELRAPSGVTRLAWAGVKAQRDLEMVNDGDYYRAEIKPSTAIEVALWQRSASTGNAGGSGLDATFFCEMSVARLHEHRLILKVPAPSSAAAKAGEKPQTLQRGDVLRVFTARLDPKDAARFFIDYELNGRRGTIGGKLQDDGRIRLTPSEGRSSLTVFNECSSVEIWDPHAAPAGDQ